MKKKETVKPPVAGRRVERLVRRRVVPSADAVANDVVKALYWVTGVNEYAALLVPTMLKGDQAGGYSQLEFHRIVGDILRATKRFRK